jgi:superfamily II DNA or RNA helicase
MKKNKTTKNNPNLFEISLQTIIEKSHIDLPADWQGLDFVKFSKQKSLFDYQQKALENTLKTLYLYFEEYKEDKFLFLKHYENNGLDADLGYNLKENSKIKQYFSSAYNIDLNSVNNKISFGYFINRMSFWMATGSGKTLVIVKLLELLGYLMQNNKIPKKDILFLTHREDLIDQFKRHVNEFNQDNYYRINLFDLKDYASHKQNPFLAYGSNIDVYYYRSDLISDEKKDKIIDFNSYDNNGNWYILLDEAHKGDKQDSKRQMFYSILSRNGFMFNFSATFTDIRDYVTCVYNFNLAKFIASGYGKHIYISRENIKALEDKENTIDIEKQKILLKILTLQTAINISLESVRKIRNDLYHKPLMLTLVNSVNTEDSDLELFFKEVGKIASGNWSNDIFNTAKTELIKELSSKDAKFEFEGFKLEPNIVQIIDKVNFKEILKYIFNSETTGKIEVLKMPSNKQELIFKLATSTSPFALMKIGDITEWLKNKLTEYEISEKFENESVFKEINNSDDINILMGSRSFYEGWDSNRPNIVLFINIGSTDAKKFVLQSIGRGVRIEPITNKRKRLLSLYNDKIIEAKLFESLKSNVQPLETLFVFGTKADDLEKVVDTLKQEEHDELIGDLFEINPDVKDKLLLIPTYRNSSNIIAEEKDKTKFEINEEDLGLVEKYFNLLSGEIILCKFDCDIRVLSKLKEAFNGQQDDFFRKLEEKPKYNNPDFLLRSIFKHFSSVIKKFDSFKQLEKEIIHFEQIRITKDKLDSLREKIEKVKKSRNKDAIKKELREKLESGDINLDKYTTEIENLSVIKNEEEIIYGVKEKLKIKYLGNHYYIPIALSESEQIDFIKHIIKNKSEVTFINELEKYLEQENNFFNQFDWWFFSKIDETLDDVYIPYYNYKTNRIDKFKPDFIFWLVKDNQYTILFVDPKGTEHTDAERKIDGYKRIFEINDATKKVNNNFIYYDNKGKKFEVKVRLLLKPATGGLEKVTEAYKQYWFDELKYLERIS